MQNIREHLTKDMSSLSREELLRRVLLFQDVLKEEDSVIKRKEEAFLNMNKKTRELMFLHRKDDNEECKNCHVSYPCKTRDLLEETYDIISNR